MAEKFFVKVADFDDRMGLLIEHEMWQEAVRQAAKAGRMDEYRA